MAGNATDGGSSSSNSPSSNNNEISPETSKRVCAHMNEDHAVSVYAMAKRKMVWPGDGGKWNISDTILKSVSLQGCLIQVVLCSGDLCQVQKVTYPFEPPLTDAAQAIHQEVCKPFSVWSNPLAPIIATIYVGLACCTLFVGVDQMTAMIESRNGLNEIISQHFWSARFFSSLVRFGFYLTLRAHTVEALYVAYHSRRTFKFSPGTTAAWLLPLSAAGFPVLFQFQELLNFHRKGREAKKEKSG